jgi:AcrR family transcriptional regulator
MSQKQMKTFQNLFAALVNLGNRKSLDEIRVSDIAKTAGVHRATFYRHVESIQDLLERGTEYFWNDLIVSMEEIRAEKPGKSADTNAPEYLRHFFSRVLENRDVFKAFLLQQYPNYFQSHARKRSIDFLTHYRLIRIGDDEQKRHLAVMIGASLYATIELVVQNGSIDPYLETYYSFVRQVNRLEN